MKLFLLLLIYGECICTHSWCSHIVQADNIITFYPLLHCLLLLCLCLPSGPSLPSNSIFETSFFFPLTPLYPPSPSPPSLYPDHSRSEMDLSVPGSELSDDAFSLRSRSVPGLNETVSAINPSLLLPPAASPHTDHTFDFCNKFTADHKSQKNLLIFFFSPTTHIYYTVRPYRAQDLWAD